MKANFYLFLCPLLCVACSDARNPSVLQDDFQLRPTAVYLDKTGSPIVKAESTEVVELDQEGRIRLAWTGEAAVRLLATCRLGPPRGLMATAEEPAMPTQRQLLSFQMGGSLPGIDTSKSAALESVYSRPIGQLEEVGVTELIPSDLIQIGNSVDCQLKAHAENLHGSLTVTKLDTLRIRIESDQFNIAVIDNAGTKPTSILWDSLRDLRVDSPAFMKGRAAQVFCDGNLVGELTLGAEAPLPNLLEPVRRSLDTSPTGTAVCRISAVAGLRRIGLSQKWLLVLAPPRVTFDLMQKTTDGVIIFLKQGLGDDPSMGWIFKNDSLVKARVRILSPTKQLVLIPLETGVCYSRNIEARNEYYPTFAVPPQALRIMDDGTLEKTSQLTGYDLGKIEFTVPPRSRVAVGWSTRQMVVPPNGIRSISHDLVPPERPNPMFTIRDKGRRARMSLASTVDSRPVTVRVSNDATPDVFVEFESGPSEHPWLNLLLFNDYKICDWK
jgi:hypothetical protein